MRLFGWCMTFALCSAGVLRADIVLLRNGQAVEGKVLGGTANQLHVRRTQPSGGTYVEKIDRVNIERVVRESTPVQTRPAEPSAATAPAQPASAPAGQTPAVELSLEDHRALVIAIAKWRAEDFVGAGTELSRLINSSEAAEREAMSAVVFSATQKTLAALAADAHLQAAIATRRGTGIRLPYVTEYEKPTLIPMLIVAFEAALANREPEPRVLLTVPKLQLAPRAVPVRGSAQPANNASPAATQPWYAAFAQSQPASEPADEAFAVIDWLDRPNEFDGSVAQARALAPHVHLATSLLNERIRLDSTLRRDAELKRRLLADRHRLTMLAKVLANYSGKPKPKALAAAGAGEAERLRREEFQKRMEAQQKEQAERLAEAQKAATKWQEEQEKANRGLSLFDWLKPAPENQTDGSGPQNQGDEKQP